MAQGSQMQIDLSKAGDAPPQDIAKAIHEYQLESGTEKPTLSARGARRRDGGSPGAVHLPGATPRPLEEKHGRFSMEPGLFDPEGGYGYNPSDNVVVGKERGWVQGSVPNLTKEWALLEIWTGDRNETPRILFLFSILFSALEVQVGRVIDVDALPTKPVYYR